MASGKFVLEKIGDNNVSTKTAHYLMKCNKVIV